jgi:RND family efflux transporter MFP subunit
MKTKIIAVVAIVLIVASAIILLKTRKANLSKAPVAAVLPVVVDAITIQAQPVTLTLPAMGVVSSDRSTTLSTKISGRINQIFKREGESVAAGELIALVDNSELEAKKRALQSKLAGLEPEINVQRASHQRTLELFKVGGAALELKQQEEAAIERLIKTRQELQQNIMEIDNLAKYARISSPVAGTLSARLVQVGDLALPGKALFKIAASDGLYLEVKLPSALHATAIIYKEQQFKLTAKNQAGASGLLEYRAQLPLGSPLVAGEFLNVALVLYSGTGELLPNDVLLTTQGTPSVLIYADGQVRRTPVTVFQRGSAGVMVNEDLSGKTLLLAKPDILLRATSGVPVHIANTINQTAMHRSVGND